MPHYDESALQIEQRIAEVRHGLSRARLYAVDFQLPSDPDWDYSVTRRELIQELRGQLVGLRTALQIVRTVDGRQE